MLTELSEMVTDSKLVLAIFLAWIQWKSLVTAFEKLLALNYNSFILTVGIIGVDSHARDKCMVTMCSVGNTILA